MKILFFASHPKLSIGYSRIANILSNYFAEKEHDVYFLAISNFGIDNVERYINPKIKLFDALQLEKANGSEELYGVNVICDLLKEINPDLLFLYNDTIVISRIFNNFIEKKININFKIWIYLDLVYEYQKIEIIKHIEKFADLILVFSDCWKKNLIEMGIDKNKISILYHGFDNVKFFPTDVIESKQKFGFDKNDFVVLNTNKNNYRKAIDKTIDAFLIFLKLKKSDPRIKLFLNMNCNFDPLAPGYDIINLIKIGCIKNDLVYTDVVTKHIFISSEPHMSDPMLNYLYNACDVGLNTCVGEGFGLCNLEHGGIGKPQIVSGVGALNDIFCNEYSIVVKPVTELYLSNDIEFHGGYIKICSVDDFVSGLIKYYDDLNLQKNHGDLSRKNILNKYNWNVILDELHDKMNKI
jgi:glycosyltransferase involved in cell wall biosynthesis